MWRVGGVERITGKLGVHLKFEEHRTACLMAGHSVWSGDPVCCCVICPGGPLSGGHRPIVCVRCVEEGSDFVSGSGGGICWSGSSFGDP